MGSDEDSKVLFSTELLLVVEIPTAAPDFSKSAGGISLESMVFVEQEKERIKNAGARKTKC